MSDTNFDDLKRLRDAALSAGRGSKAYFTFCEAVFEGFPAIYETAKNTNETILSLRADIEKNRPRGFNFLRSIKELTTN